MMTRPRPIPGITDPDPISGKRVPPLQRILRFFAGKRYRPAPATLSGPQAEIGAMSEEAATLYLCEQKNFRILARNWRSGREEIDIIARDREILVFVEVRARQSTALVSGYHSVTKRKKEALRRAAIAYLRKINRRAEHYRFDIVEIRLCMGEIESLQHFENIPVFRSHD